MSFNAVAIVGKAVPTAVWSSALKNVDTMMARKLIQNARVFRGGRAAGELCIGCWVVLANSGEAGVEGDG